MNSAICPLRVDEAHPLIQRNFFFAWFQKFCGRTQYLLADLQILIYKIAILQGDTSGSSQPIVDIKTFVFMSMGGWELPDVSPCSIY